MSGAAHVDGSCHRVDLHLQEVADHGQPAAHVAVQRAVRRGQLRLVAGGQQQGVELVGPRHEERSADPRLDVLLRDVGLPSLEHRCQRLQVRREDLFYRKDPQARPQRAGQRAGVGHASLRGVAGRKPENVHLVGAQRLHGQHRHEGRVDSPGQPQVHAREAALADVIPDSQHERPFDLRKRVRGRQTSGPRAEVSTTASSSSNAFPR